ncbi:MAG: hypothetical protein AB7U85_01540 [Alphaproteobacteria bacterium]
MDKKEPPIKSAGDYIIAINKEREVLISMPLLYDMPEKAVIIYDGGDHALLKRNKDTSVLLDYVTPEFKYYTPRSDKLYIAEFGGKLNDFSTVRWTYIARILNEELPITDLPPSREEIFEKLEQAKIDGNLEEVAAQLAEEYDLF